MRRVVVTGMGIVSPIGNDLATVTDALVLGRSGITASKDMRELGFRSQVHGQPIIDWKEHVPRRSARFMSEGIGWAYIAMDQAIADAGLTNSALISHPRTGLIVGSGGPSVRAQHEASGKLLTNSSPKSIGPFAVPKAMSSGPSANLSVAFRIKGVNQSVTSACSTSAHCIGNAALRIMLGQQDIVFAGGCEELDPLLSALFDAMAAMSSNFNATPTQTPCAYDLNRDGFVIAGGAGILALEEYEHAKRRNARIYAELVGYGENSDGEDMVAPSGEGAVRCMIMALKGFPDCHAGIGRIDYINAHGTATKIGDEKEIAAIQQVFNDPLPLISSTKSITGHSLGAAGAWEAIFSILMLTGNFVAKSANIAHIDPSFAGIPIARETERRQLSAVMSNSFGFGGTNATLIFKRV